MMFENPAIELSELPKAETLQLQPVDPRLKKVVFIQWAILWLILFGGTLGLYFIDSLNREIFMIAWPVMAVLAGFHLFVTIKSVQYKAYAVRTHDVVWKTGWLVQSTRIVPFNRIQHCSVDAGVLQRKFGLKSLSLFTAGSNMADVRITGLPEQTAESLRDLIVSKLGDHAAIL